MPVRIAAAVAALVLAAAATAASLALLDRSGAAEPGTATPTPTFVSEHPVAVPEEPRTVTISTTMPLPSAHERRMSAMLEEGAMPAHPVPATVVTDTECVPDEELVSRCRNELLLEDGSTIVLRHPHRMSEVPCLAPGEQVRLLPQA